MTQEEKSKAYDKALEIARKELQTCGSTDCDAARQIYRFFPELKESEDEKIRKELIEHVKDQQSSFISAPDCRDKYEEEENNKYNAWLDWLEKQEGCECIKKDWLEHIKQSWYKEGFIDGKYSDGTSKEWTKNDTATLKELIDFLENGTAKLQHDLTRYANWLKIQLTPIKKQGKPTDINPSEFDLRLNKLLKQFKTLPKEELANSLSFYLNVVQNDGTYKSDEKQGGQKPANKTEPFDKYEGLTDFERTLADICIGWIGEELGWKQYIKDNADVLLKIAIEKFSSVQDASFEQKPAWSEEDEHRINRISDFIWKNRKGDTDEIYQQEQDVNWLKSLRPQPKQEWSEEDEKNLQGIIDEIQANKSSAPSYDINVYDRYLSWLKSLRPQKQWRPSDEQMVALSEASGIVGMYSLRGMNLQSLYNDLKKL